MKSINAWLVVLLSGVAGCVLAPPGTREQRDRAVLEGRGFALPREQRALPDVSPEASPEELLARAFAANGEVEGVYFEWLAAIAEIDIAAGYPNTDWMVGVSYRFGGDARGWDRASVSLAPNSMRNLALPWKVMAAGEVALANARAAESRLRRARLAIQERLLTAYYEHALLGERQRLQQELVALLELVEHSSRARLQTGGGAVGPAAVSVMLERARLQGHALAAEVDARRTEINAITARPIDAPLRIPAQLPAPRLLPSDADILATGVSRNPELESLRHAAEAGAHALELARLQFLPDINPFVGIEGGMEQVVGAAFTLSTMLPQLRAGIAVAAAKLRTVEAGLRQANLDGAAALVVALLAIRNLEHQFEVLDRGILPLARLASSSARSGYEVGEMSLQDFVEAERTLLELRGILAEVRMDREIQVARLEAQVGVEVVSLAEPDASQKNGGEYL